MTDMYSGRTGTASGRITRISVHSTAMVRSLAALALCLLPIAASWAQTPTGNLTDLVESGIYAYNGLEIAAAASNDAAYGALLKVCGGNAAGGPTCSGNQLLLFDRLREL